MDGEVARDFLACNDRDDLKKLLCKLKEKYMMEKMKHDPKFATSPIFVNPYHGYENETIVEHLMKLNDICLLMMKTYATIIS